MGVLGHLGGLVVADLGCQGGDQHQAAVQQVGDACLVGFDAGHAAVGEGAGAVGDQADRLQHVVDDHRLEHVQLEMALAAGHGDGGVVAHHLGAHHGQRLGLGRVDLARHDRRAGLVFRQLQLADAAARAGAQQPDVVGDLEQAGGDHVQRAGGLDHCVVGGQRLELVVGGHERQVGDGGDLGGHLLGEARFGVDAGAHGGAALGELVECRQHVPHPPERVLHLRAIAGKRLAQGQRRGVLQVGAPDLDDGAEGLRLFLQRLQQMFQGGDQPMDHLLGHRDVHGGGEGVVGRLRPVAVVVGVHRVLRAQRAAQNLDRPVGDHLVGVHVGLGARAGLPHHQGEVVVQLAVDHVLGGTGDGLGDLRFQIVQLRVGARGRLLDDAQRADHRPGQAFAADGEVDQRALGLRAPVAIGRDLQVSERIAFHAYFDVGHSPSPARAGGGMVDLTAGPGNGPARGGRVRDPN